MAQSQGSTLSLHDALPISGCRALRDLRYRHFHQLNLTGSEACLQKPLLVSGSVDRSEEHTSELQSRPHLVCRLLLEKKKKICIKDLNLVSSIRNILYSYSS